MEAPATSIDPAADVAWEEFRTTKIAELVWSLVDVSPQSLAAVRAVFDSGFGRGRIVGIHAGFDGAESVLLRTRGTK